MDSNSVLGKDIMKHIDECVKVVEETVFELQLGDAEGDYDEFQIWKCRKRIKIKDKRSLFFLIFIEKYRDIIVVSCEVGQWTLDKLSRALN